MATKEDVQIGDVIEVPPGVDAVCTTRYRIRVDERSSYGASGPRVKADGSLMASRSVLSESGNVERTVPWSLMDRVIVHKATPGQREAGAVEERVQVADVPEGVSAVPTHAEVMSLVRQYALARIMENGSTPTKRQRENPACVAIHEGWCRDAERLARDIALALARAGLK